MRLIPIGLLVGLAAAAYGHSARLQFDSWGGFNEDALRCQRTIARSAAICAHDAWTAQRACASAKLAGQNCDQDATDAAIAATRKKALDGADAYCREEQLRPLEYLGPYDMESDIIKFCRDWETTAVFTVYAQMQRAAALTVAERECIAATADVTDFLMQFTFRARRQCMDHIASLPLDTANHRALLESTTKRLNQMRRALATRLAARCGRTMFELLYQLTPEDFIDGLTIRADCLGGQLYIQNAVLCPGAVCGNGIVEPGEDCDDANLMDGDACPSSCRLQ